MDEATPLVSSDHTAVLYSSEEGKSTASASSSTTTNASVKNAGSISNDKPKKKKRKIIRLCVKSALVMEQQVQMNMIKHNLASRFFQHRQFWCLTIPQAILTMISSILAFVATTELFDVRATIIINTIVGSTSGVVVFLQTMCGICAYGTRGAMHEAVAIDLRDLRDDLVLLRCKLGLEDYMQNIKQDVCDESDEEDEYDHSFESIQNRFQQSLSGCKSNVPMALSEAFHGVKSNYMVILTKTNIRSIEKVCGYESINEFRRFKIYDVLATEILDSLFFPMFLPNAKKVVDATMRRFQYEIKTHTASWVEEKDDDEAELTRLSVIQRGFGIP